MSFNWKILCLVTGLHNWIFYTSTKWRKNGLMVRVCSRCRTAEALKKYGWINIHRQEFIDALIDGDIEPFDDVLKRIEET